MNFLGLTLRRPTFNQFTSAVILAVGLWLALLGGLRAAGHAMDLAAAAAALVVLAWGCVGAQLGIHVGRGPRHLVANLAVSALLLVLLQVLLWATGH